MARYAIYAGVDGACSLSLMFTDEYPNEIEALEDAYREAVEMYESYCGRNGVYSWSDCRDELENELGYEPADEEIDDYYEDVINNTIEYCVKKLEEGEEPEDV